VEIISITLFFIGLASSIHCLGMCGSIITALSLGLPSEIRNSSIRISLIVLAYNCGRIGSYTLAGALAGIIGNRFSGIFEIDNGHLVLQIMASIILIMLGLNIAGWMPRFKQIEIFGAGVWKYLRPLGKRFLPVTTISKALLIGTIWGWLPCGLVYSILLLAITSGSSQQGAIYLFIFGMGTLPCMFTAGVTVGLFRQYAQNISIRRIAGLLIIIVGLVTPLIQYDHYGKYNQEIHHINVKKITANNQQLLSTKAEVYQKLIFLKSNYVISV
jgi:sulfite exporter TauE/SafE